MRLAALLTVSALVGPVSLVSLEAQSRSSQSRGQRAAAPAITEPSSTAEAYGQFLLAHRFEQSEETDKAIAAYKRAMELDPRAADIPAELSALYLRQNRVKDAVTTAEAALKVSPTNREANRVLGLVYAAMAGSRDSRVGDSAANLAKAIGYLEVATDRPASETDPNLRATLARLYMRAGSFDKAIPLLVELTTHESGWLDGPILLVQAYTSAGRLKDAITWLETKAPEDPRLLPTLAD